MESKRLNLQISGYTELVYSLNSRNKCFSENFRLFIDFHLWSLSKSVWGAPTGLQGFDEGVVFQTWLHTVPCQLLGYDNR